MCCSAGSAYPSKCVPDSPSLLYPSNRHQPHARYAAAVGHMAIFWRAGESADALIRKAVCLNTRMCILPPEPTVTCVTCKPCPANTSKKALLTSAAYNQLCQGFYLHGSALLQQQTMHAQAQVDHGLQLQFTQHLVVGCIQLQSSRNQNVWTVHAERYKLEWQTCQYMTSGALSILSRLFCAQGKKPYLLGHT